MIDELTRKAMRYRWLVFSIMASAYVSSVFHRIATAVVALDIQESLNISAGLMGLLASTYFYSYAAIQLPGGLLSDSLGPRRSAGLFLLAAGAGSILFGLAPDLETALAGRILVGVGAGMVFTPTMKIVSEWFTAREFSRMNALMLTTGGIGALTAATPLALMASRLGWRESFEVIGAATFVLSGLVFLFVYDRPEEAGWPRLNSIAAGEAAHSESPAPISLRQGIGRVVRERGFWTVALWAFCTLGVFFSFGGLWAGPYLMHVYGMTRAEAGGVLDMIAVGTVLGSFGVSYLSESILRSRRKVLMISSTALLAELLFLRAFPQQLPVGALYLLVAVFSAISLAPAVISITTVKELFPVQIAGTSIGTVNMFPFLGGAFFQFVVGLALDSFPRFPGAEYPIEAYCAMFTLLLMPAAIALACTFLMKETYGRSLTA